MAMVALDAQGSARIQIMQHPPGLPGKCAICGYAGGEDRGFIDFGLDIDFYGGVFFCTHCVITMAEVMGYVTPEKYDEMVSQYQEAVTERLRVDELNESYGVVIHNLTGGLSLDDIRKRVLGIEDADEPDIAPEEDEPVLDEPVSVEGRNDLSGSIDDLGL